MIVIFVLLMPGPHNSYGSLDCMHVDHTTPIINVVMCHNNYYPHNYFYNYYRSKVMAGLSKYVASSESSPMSKYGRSHSHSTVAERDKAAAAQAAIDQRSAASYAHSTT